MANKLYFKQNKMVVTDCYVGLEKMTADNVRDTLIAERNTDGNFAGNAIDQLRTIGGLCNAAVFDAQTKKLPLNERKIHGDATDTAILRFSESLGPISEMKRCWHTKFDLAFNSKNKFMIRVLSMAVCITPIPLLQQGLVRSHSITMDPLNTVNILM